MSDFDLDRLGDVWRQQLEPAEMARLQRTAAAVSRRARIGQFLDILAGAAVSVVVIFLVWTNPRFETFLLGAAAIIVLLLSNVRLRKIRQVELRGLTGSTEDMLDQSIDRLETTLRYKRFSLIAIGPALAIGLLLAWTAGTNPGVLVAPVLRLALRGTTFAVLAGVAVFLIVAIRRERRELGRLRAMRESYRLEGESTGS
jgi:membrane protein implicated in regulation of membrane protease activity